MVTRKNLEMIGDNMFMTSLTLYYNEEGRVVSEEVAEKKWEEIGKINESKKKKKRINEIN